MPAVLEYKCPSCGAGIHFDSGLQRMKCPYCDTEFDAEALSQFNAVEEAPREADWEDHLNPWDEEGLKGYICPSCAGELVGDATTAATRCPYCGNPAVMPSQLSGMYKPDYVIPFKLDKNAAKKAFAENLKGKKLLPKNFRDSSVLEEITGVYVPFWLFDCEAGSAASYRATKVKTWSDRKYRYTRTDHYQIRRAGEAAFSGIPADGSAKMDDAYMDAVEPYDYHGILPFGMTYLSGYLADKYDLTAQESRPRVEARAAESMERSLKGTVGGYNSCTKESGQVWINHAKSNYALLPVWTLNVKYGERLYRFAMNGQTGKFIGELPVDKGRARGYFFGIFAALGALAALVALIAGGM